MKRILHQFPKLFLATLLVFCITVSYGQSSKNRGKGKGAGMKKGNATAMKGHGGNMKGKSGKMMPFTDSGFLRKNIMDNMMEIRLSDLGRERGNDEIRRVAEVIAKDHGQILSDLTTLAGKLDVVVPENNMDIPLSGDLNNEEFTRTWINQMLGMHQAKIKELQMAIPKIKDAALRATAESALPKITLHHEMLTGLKEKEKQSK